MKTGRSLSAIILCTLVAYVGSCRDDAASAAAPVPDPMKTVVDLLKLHDMLGKQPEERSEQSRKKKVDGGKLSNLFADIDGRDRFLADLYVGFVAGAIARNQNRLRVDTDGDRAEVTAGKAKVMMRLEKGRWRISLDESVPLEIKKLAALEKERFDNALYYK